MESHSMGPRILAFLSCLLFFVAMGEASGESSNATPLSLYTDPGNQFQFEVPDGWSVGTDADGVFVRHSGSDAFLKIMPDPGCFEGTSAAALEVMDARIQAYSQPPEFRIVEAPSYYAVDAHAGAKAFAARSDSYGSTYLVLWVVLGPEWATVWTFAGFMRGTAELALAPTMNATIESFDVMTAPAATSLTDAEGRFSVDVPPGWIARANVSLGTDHADAVLSSPRGDVSFVITSEPRVVESSYESALPILQEALNGLASEPGYAVLDGPASTLVDGHPAAQATVTWQPSTYNIVQVIVVVPAPEWSRFWGLLGSMFSWDVPIARSCIDATVSSFDIQDAPAADGRTLAMGFLTAFQEAYPWLLGAAAAVTATEGATIAYLTYRQRRRKKA